MIVRKFYRIIISEEAGNEGIDLEKWGPHRGNKITVSWGYDSV
jgi:hypothetical protein